MLRSFPGWSAVLAAALGLTGLVLLFQHEILAGELTAQGGLLVLAGALVAAIGNTLSQVLMKRGMSIVALSTSGMSIGALAMCSIALLRGDFAHVAWDPIYLGSLLYLALIGTIVAFGLYFQLVRRIGPTRAAYSSVFFPLVALTISALLEDYAITPIGWFGVLLLMGGAALAIERRR